MADTTLSGLCRLSVHAPDRRFDLSVPADVPLGDLLPAIIEYAGPREHERGLAHQGWVLQRLGDEPLDEDHTVNSLGLHDGELVYLRPRSDQMPPVHFDDLVDGIATALRPRPGAWHPAYTRYLLLGLALVTLLAALVTLAVLVPQGPRVVGAFAAACALLLGAGAASRAMGDLAASLLLGVSAVGYAVLAGTAIPAGTAVVQLAGARVFTAALCGAGVALLDLVAVAAVPPVFIALAAGCTLVAVGGLIVMLSGVPLASGAALVAALAVVFILLMPTLSLRIAGLRIPPLPGNAEQLQEGIDPYPGPAVVSRARLTDEYATAFGVSAGLVCTLCLTVLAADYRWEPAAFGGALALLLLLHARVLGSAWQRLAIVVPGGYGVALLTLEYARHAPELDRLAVVAGWLGCAAVLLILSWTVPGNRPVPYWGRAGDVLHSLFAFSLVPLLLFEFGAYGWARGLFN